MSDFIDRVLAKSLGAAPAGVRPRPVARFEQADLAPVRAAEEARAVESLAPVVAPRDAPPRPPAPSPAQVQPIAPEPTVTRELLTIREERAAPLREIAPTSHPGPVTTEHTPGTSSARPAPPAAPLTPLGEKPPRESATPHAAQPAARTAPTEPGPLAPVAPLAPIAPAHAPPAPARPPIVNVRIGRVELHAPHSPAARPQPPRSAPPAPARPVRTLDDYLRSRDEERR
ncbi:MAG: hypothetical protein RLZZ387_3952 [Chloroflexota bacterium]|jgi:hypothetical protein